MIFPRDAVETFVGYDLQRDTCCARPLSYLATGILDVNFIDSAPGIYGLEHRMYAIYIIHEGILC